MNRNYTLVRLALMVVSLLGLMPSTASATTPAIAPVFRDYYAAHQGWRVLGAPLTNLLTIGDREAQYFEKGRIEDHRGTVADRHWAFMFGRLSAELMERAPEQPVNATKTTYAELARVAEAQHRRAAPIDFTGGTIAVQDGIFIPFDPQLRPASGYVVPLYFWTYINQPELFPGGWLHDVGLPMSPAFLTDTVKNGARRQIMMQAFERTVLTYDPQNPEEWQVERGNIGADAVNLSRAVGKIELPEANAVVTLPLRILARVGQPGETLTVALRWANGVTLSRSMSTLSGENGQGLLIGSLDWLTESRPPQPAAHAATLEIRDSSGTVLGQQSLQVLRWDDPDVQRVKLYWLLGDNIRDIQQHVPRTLQIGTAALRELLWGPKPGNLAGFRTAIPSPQEVLTYRGRTDGWGERVTLRKLTIEDGTATADFGRELLAYGGDTARATLIGRQISRTLLQFPSVQRVTILVEGELVPALQP